MSATAHRKAPLSSLEVRDSQRGPPLPWYPSSPYVNPLSDTAQQDAPLSPHGAPELCIRAPGEMKILPEDAVSVDSSESESAWI